MIIEYNMYIDNRLKSYRFSRCIDSFKESGCTTVNNAKIYRSSYGTANMLVTTTATDRITF